MAFRIANDDPQNDGSGRRFNRDVAKLERAFKGIRCAVFQEELDLVSGFFHRYEGDRPPGDAADCSSSVVDWGTST